MAALRAASVAMAASASWAHTTDPAMPISAIAPAAPATAESTVTAMVRTPGSYLAVVIVRARVRRERVVVYLPGRPRREVRANPRAATRVSYQLALAAGRLRVRAVSDVPAVHLALVLSRQLAPSPGSSAGTTSAAPTTPVSTATPSVVAQSPAAPPPVVTPPTPPPPPVAPDPYTNLKFDDEFTGAVGTAPSSQNWTSDVPGSGCGDGTLSTDTASTANAVLNGQGQLVITALSNGRGGYTSAQLDTTGRYSFEYGSAQARILLPPGQGLCSAFWLLGDSTPSSPCVWPGCGEIDALEAPSFGPVPTNAVFTLHGTMAGGQTQQFETSTSALGDLSAGWHTYGVIWSPGSIIWTIDGVAYASATPGALVPGSTWDFDNRPFHLLLDLAVGGWPGSPAGTGAFPARMLVDWVRVYQ